MSALYFLLTPLEFYSDGKISASQRLFRVVKKDIRYGRMSDPEQSRCGSVTRRQAL